MKATFRYGKLSPNELFIDITTDTWSESLLNCWKPYYADGEEAPEITLIGAAIRAVALFPQILTPFAESDVHINAVLDQLDRMGLGQRHDSRTAELF